MICQRQKKKREQQIIQQVKRNKKMSAYQLYKGAQKSDCMKQAFKIEQIKEKRKLLMQQIRAEAVRQRIQDFYEARQIHRQIQFQPPQVINKQARNYINRTTRLNILTYRIENAPIILTQEQLSDQARNVRRILKALGQTSHKGQNRPCRICLEQIQEKQLEVFLLCFHSFHKSCIQNWFANKIICPVCKNDVKQELQKVKTKYESLEQ